MKIFQIGFNRCGTVTLHRYLLANGLRSVHGDKGRLAQRMFRNLANGDNLLTGYEEFHVFSDMEFLDVDGTLLEGYKLFPYLAREYPDGIFILNTRNREAWIRSRMQHGRKVSYALRQMKHHNVASRDELADIWRADWDRHHRRVLDFFCGGRYRFFMLPIETGLPQLLNEKIPEYRLDETHYRVRNRAKSGPRRPALHRYARHIRRSAESLLRGTRD